MTQVRVAPHEQSLCFAEQRAAVPVLPPDPLQVLDLQRQEGENPEQDRSPRHPLTVAQERAARNGPPDSFLKCVAA